MKLNKIGMHLVILFGIGLLPFGLCAQIIWSPQYLGRAEYRHGFQALSGKAQDPAFFVSQRARLGFKYNAEKFKIGMSVQDIRTWGSTSNSAIDATGLLSLHEGFVEVLFNSKLSVKAGRQEIAYDEDRIFGSLDWAMQARRHDAALIKWEDSTLKVHVGTAYNQDRELFSTAYYSVAGNYKTFQYLYCQKIMNKLNLSLLVLNNGLQWRTLDSTGAVTASGIRFSQTAGLRAAYIADKLGANGTFYLQIGKDVADKDLFAYQASAEVFYKLNSKIKLTLGGEILSGTTQINPDATKNNSFNPFYGTNHRFNGYMDYFYVGNHANSVGLIDPYVKILYSPDRFYAGLDVHYFLSAADIRDVTNPTTAMSSALGIELDLSLGYKITDHLSLQGGYSHMLGTDSMVAIRGGAKDEISNWAYFSILARPGAAKFPRTGLKI